MENPQVADFFELEKLGIKRTIKLGKNEFGFNEKIVELNDGTQYDYIPEDNLYEIRTNRMNLAVY